MTHSRYVKDNNLISRKDNRTRERLDFRDITREIVFELDENNKIIYVNSGWENILGYEPKETIGRLMTEFLDKGHDFVFINEDLKEGRYEKIFTHKNGEKRYLDMIIRAIFNDNGRVVGAYGSALDITEIKMGEKKAVQLRDLVENSKDIIYHYQVLPEKKFIYLSPAINDVLGHPRELDYMDPYLVYETIHPDDRHWLEKKAKGEVDFDKPIKCRWLHSSGEYIWMEEYMVPVYDKNSRLVSVYAVCRDITQQYLADQEKEKLLKEKIKYEKLKTEFFSNMSHEFRTPLNIILGSIQLLEGLMNKNQKDSTTASLGKYLNMVKQNCYRLLRLINNLIDISRADTEFLNMDYKNYNIVEVVEDITLSVAEYVKNKGISLTFDTEIEERIMACDLDKMERVMLNLLSNAIKFTDNMGHIWVSISEQENEITISVKDTGIGIPENMLEKVFDRFRQVNSLLTRAHEGSGIGLSLVKSIIEAHGGRISAKSEYGNGTEFIINLPVKLVKEDKFIDQGDLGMRHNKIEKMKVELSDIYR